MRKDKIFTVVFGMFSIMVIFISVIVILGLIIITINQNIKEMSIRKVLDAEWMNIYKILFRKMSRQFVIAVPFGMYGFQKGFLENYIDHINLSWIHIIATVFILSFIFIAIIYMQSKKVLRINPSGILKSE